MNCQSVVLHVSSLCFEICLFYGIKCNPHADINLALTDRLQLAQDICHGMTFLHSMETSLPRLELNPFHIFVSYNIQCNYIYLISQVH